MEFRRVLFRSSRHRLGNLVAVLAQDLAPRVQRRPVVVDVEDLECGLGRHAANPTFSSALWISAVAPPEAYDSLERTAVARASSRRSSGVNTFAVFMTIGMSRVAGSDDSSRRTSRPEHPGITTSQKITSGRSRRAIATPSGPF